MDVPLRKNSPIEEDIWPRLRAGLRYFHGGCVVGLCVAVLIKNNLATVKIEIDLRLMLANIYPKNYKYCNCNSSLPGNKMVD